MEIQHTRKINEEPMFPFRVNCSLNLFHTSNQNILCTIDNISLVPSIVGV